MNPSKFVLSGYSKILQVRTTDILAIGRSIPIPIFEEENLNDLAHMAIDIFRDQPTMLRIDDPVIIVGDLHGSLHDLLRIFAENGLPDQRKYLFLGDYVDRGPFSLEVITLLFAFVCKFPRNVFLIRGNHEFENTNGQYGFKDEIINSGYSEDLWKLFNDAFSYLPLASLLYNSFLCLHGGISPHLNNLSQIESIVKPVLDYADPLVCDIVWADPSETYQLYSKSTRGNGNHFGTTAVNIFIESSGIKKIIRAHQCVMNGFELFAQGAVITVFSASSYDKNLSNKSGVLNVVDSNFIKPQVYDELPIITRVGVMFEKPVVRTKNCYETSIGRCLQTRNGSCKVCSGMANPYISVMWINRKRSNSAKELLQNLSKTQLLKKNTGYY